MPARKAPPSIEQRAKIAATLTGRKLTPEHKANISAANKGRKLTMSDRVLRSLTAMMQDRGAKLNAMLAANPDVDAARRAKASANIQKINDARRAAKLALSPAVHVSASMRRLWASSAVRRVPA